MSKYGKTHKYVHKKDHQGETKDYTEMENNVKTLKERNNKILEELRKETERNFELKTEI